MTKSLLANIRVEHTERAVELVIEGFATIAEVGAYIRAQADEHKSGDQGGEAARSTRAVMRTGMTNRGRSPRFILSRDYAGGLVRRASHSRRSIAKKYSLPHAPLNQTLSM